MVTPKDKIPQRADKILKLLFPALSGRHIEEALATGLVTLSGSKIKKGTYVIPSELESSKLISYLQKLRAGNRSLSLSVVYESADEWIIDKPSGMPSQPLSLFDWETPTHWALALDPQIQNEFLEVQPVLCPHRLDKGTSGALVVCRKKNAFLNWRGAFEKKEVKKKYLAWCVGQVTEDELIISESIGHDPRDPRKMMVVFGPEKYRSPLLEAQTKARLLKIKEEFSLWEIECSTGVTHQIRVHLASRALPLVGDFLYDPEAEKKAPGLTHHQLRAYELTWDDRTFKLETDEFKKGPH
jgi:23S rRNA pseudouridine1911/1915/1917 synthase